MKTTNKKKRFGSVKIQYKGCLYHSLLELKFVLLIEDKCSWIREPIAIFYNPDNLEVTQYINENTRKYIPDFLVRKWKENTAHLIEIKPKQYMNSEQMQIRKEIANKYLDKKDVDWKYTVITEEDIVLNEKQTALFEKIVSENKNFGGKLALIRKDKKYNNTPQMYFHNIPYLNTNDISEEDYKRYVKFGILPPANGGKDVLMEEPVEYSSISEKEKHLNYLKNKFRINCSKQIFNTHEIELLEKYGSWLEALFLQKIKPITNNQKTFLEQINNNELPNDDIAKVWFKYIKRKEIENKPDNRLNIQYTMDNNDFYRREDYYNLHSNKKRTI